jgi:hypothetical protein
MGRDSEVFVSIDDTAKNKHAVAVAETGHDGETRYLSDMDGAPAAIDDSGYLQCGQ